jgi:hypothetical protein
MTCVVSWCGTRLNRHQWHDAKRLVNLTMPVFNEPMPELNIWNLCFLRSNHSISWELSLTWHQFFKTLPNSCFIVSIVKYWPRDNYTFHTTIYHGFDKKLRFRRSGYFSIDTDFDWSTDCIICLLKRYRTLLLITFIFLVIYLFHPTLLIWEAVWARRWWFFLIETGSMRHTLLSVSDFS